MLVLPVPPPRGLMCVDHVLMRWCAAGRVPAADKPRRALYGQVGDARASVDVAVLVPVADDRMGDEHGDAS
jgi:hypothetical protein